MSHEFNPNKDIAEARAANPALNAAYEKSEVVTQKYIDPMVEFFDTLEKEITEMPIATRFRTDKEPDLTGIYNINPLMRGLTEAEFKKAQLLGDLQVIRTRVMLLSGWIEGLVMDMEATKSE